MLKPSGSLPLKHRIINNVATKIGGMRLRSLSLDKEFLQDAARERTGLQDFGDDYYEEGLDVLLDSAKKDVNLTFYGRIALVKGIVESLGNRLLFIQKIKDTPSEHFNNLKPPIIVTGLPRTGTTFLHRLIAADRNNRGIPYWQCNLLFPPFGKEDDRRKFMAKNIKAHKEILGSIDESHHIDVDEPEECIFIFAITFHSPLFSNIAPFVSYLSWLKQANMDKPYSEYRKVLELLQLEQPEKRFALKSPSHISQLESLTKNIPEALIIQTHRHPKHVNQSLINRLYETHNLFCKDDDPYATARGNFEALVRGVNKNLDFRSKNQLNIYDVHYNSLTSNPIETVSSIYRHFDLPPHADFNTDILNYIEANKKQKRSGPQKKLEDFKIEREEENERFRSYVKEYAIEE